MKKEWFQLLVTGDKNHIKEIKKVLDTRRWNASRNNVQLIESFYFDKNGVIKKDF